MKRRSFLKLAAATGAAAAIAPRLASAKISYPDAVQGSSGTAPDSDSGHEWKHGLCLACHGGCAIIGKVKDGELLKIEGNPYSHNTHDYMIPKGTFAQPGDIDKNEERGTVCPKGAAGVYTLYNPRRLLHPVKRAGGRGSRKWKRISWDQAYDEIANGGDLFGEGHVDGLAAIRSDSPIDGGDSDFMDEAGPDGYGPKRNQFRWERGRNENGPTTNLLHVNYGTLNKGTHWTICEASERILTGMVGNSGAVHDAKNCDYLISAGGNIYDASFPAQTQARYLSKWFLRRPGTKYVYVGPRQSKSAGPSGNTEWVPIKSGTDPAFALGMIRWIIENNAYAADMIARPNADAAAAGGYPASTDATFLVKTSEPMGYMTDGAGDNLVVSGGSVVKASSVSGTADLNGATAGAKSAFTLLTERAMSMSADEYDDACGIPRGTIARIANEFTSASAPVIYQYKGPCQHSNATGASAYAIINVIMDRMWRVGGSSGRGGGAHGHIGTAEDSPSRTGEGSGRASGAAYAGAKARPSYPWYPLNGSEPGDGVQTSTYEGIANNYPYKVKAMLHYRSDPLFTLPRAQVADKALENPGLLIAVDQFCNETSMLGDYMLPDVTYMEHYGDYHSHGIVKQKEASIRFPLVGTEDHANQKLTHINPDTRSVNDIHIELAMKLGLPNVGPGGAGHGDGFVNGYQFYNLFFDTHDEFNPASNYKGGLDPNADTRQTGGNYGSAADRSDLKTGKHLSVYLAKVATAKNSLSGAYMDGLPYVGQIANDGSMLADHWDMDDFQVGTNKRMQHTQSRTGENLWLMSLEPTNALDMNPEDAAKYGVVSGDWVELTNGLGETGQHQVQVTNTTRPGYGEITNSFGHWEMGAKDIEIEGHEGGGIKGDARCGSGTNYVRLNTADPTVGGDDATTQVPTDPIGGSSMQYGYPVKVRKV
jgi:anaerobic selenocysteine-containing dehydrogenase